MQKEIRRDKRRIWPKESIELQTGLRSVRAEDAPRPRRQPKGGEDSVLNTDTGKGAGRKSKICFHFRDHGNCPKGDKCEYSLLRSFVLAETVLEPHLIVVAKTVRGMAVGKETEKVDTAVLVVEGLDATVLGGGLTRLTGEEIEAEDGAISKVSCVLTS